MDSRLDDPARAGGGADPEDRTRDLGGFGLGSHAGHDRARRGHPAAGQRRPVLGGDRREQPAVDRGLSRRYLGPAAGAAARRADCCAGAAQRRAAAQPGSRGPATSPRRGARAVRADCSGGAFARIDSARRRARRRVGPFSMGAVSPRRRAGTAPRRRVALAQHTSPPACRLPSQPTSQAPDDSPRGGYRHTQPGWGRCTRECSPNDSEWPPPSTR
jgi:hypothetical protein